MVGVLFLVLALRAEGSLSNTNSVILQAESVSLARTDSGMQLSFYLRAQRVGRPAKDLVVHVSPLFTDGRDSIFFPDISILNTRAYWSHRNMAMRAHPYDTAAHMQVMHLRGDTMTLYRATMPYEPWMADGRLFLVQDEAVGCDTRHVYELPVHTSWAVPDTAQHTDTTWHERVVEPAGVYASTLRIAFRLDSTTLDTAYLSNSTELAQLDADFRRFTEDRDLVVTRVTMHGYASPEGRYGHNADLAEGRMQTIRDYVLSRYGLADSLVVSGSTPENWQGLRDSLLTWTGGAERDSLTAMSFRGTDEDVRLSRMMRRYPKTMQRLKRELFPLLRYTEYTIEYSRIRDKVHREMQTELRVDTLYGEAQPDALQVLPRRKPLFELKTNLLFDAAMTPNIEIEVPIGYHPWSIMAEWWTPWYVFGRGQQSTMGTGAYSFMMAGVELRYWFRRRCEWVQPVMNGHFLGLYGAGGFYDIQTQSNRDGWQGEYTSIGLTYGYVIPLAPFWNMEFSVSAGYMGGPQRYYKGMFNDEHLIWQEDRHLWYIGPTKLKISIGYMFNAKEKRIKKKT